MTYEEARSNRLCLINAQRLAAEYFRTLEVLLMSLCLPSEDPDSWLLEDAKFAVEQMREQGWVQ